MKKNFLFLLFIVFSCTQNSCTQKGSKSKNGLLKFEYNTHDFKTIPKGIGVLAVFKFKNKGETPLIIYDVKTSCGCTVPEWTKDVIVPNKYETIKVSYDAKHFGNFSKTITVFYNGKNSPQLLTIKGEVVYRK